MWVNGTAIMRSLLTIILVVLFPGMLGAADIKPLTGIPIEATALYAKLIGKIQPNARPFINEQALKLRQGATDANAVSSSLDTIFSAAGIAGMDVAEAAFIVMMMATKDMDSDIKDIMEEVKTFTSAKQKLRDLTTRVNQDVAKNGRKKDTDACAPPACGGYQAVMIEISPVLKRVRTRTPFVPRETVNIGQLRNLANDLKNDLDSLDEMSEITLQRLNLTMDRRSKFISTLSNIMKKISTTQDTIIQNLK
jgi:hypothetical protein